MAVQEFAVSQDKNTFSTHQEVKKSSDASVMPPTILDRCYKGRFQGFWDFDFNRMRFFDPVCDESLVTLVKLPNIQDASVKKPNKLYQNHTNPVLFYRLEGSCVLLLGDSTDRQHFEQWCPRWVAQGEKREIWMPPNRTKHLSKRQLGNVGNRCNVQNKFTFGTYMHYGVSPPPYWKYAHMYVRGPKNLEWGNTTETRVKQDVPKFFQRCDEVGHDKFKVVVLQSYLWDLAREHLVGKNARPSPRFISDWAQNVTTLVGWVREAVPDATIAWRFAGDIEPGDGWDSRVLHDMNAAIIALGDKMKVDFFTDYGAVLSSALASVKNAGPFEMHPPDEPQTGYVNIMLNALVAAYESKVNA
jgi:hypothetical protein